MFFGKVVLRKYIILSRKTSCADGLRKPEAPRIPGQEFTALPGNLKFFCRDCLIGNIDLLFFSIISNTVNKDNLHFNSLGLSNSECFQDRNLLFQRIFQQAAGACSPKILMGICLQQKNLVWLFLRMPFRFHTRIQARHISGLEELLKVLRLRMRNSRYFLSFHDLMRNMLGIGVKARERPDF